MKAQNLNSGITCLNHISWILFGQVLETNWDYFYQNETGIEIFSDKNCKVTFGFEYMGRIKRIWYLSPLRAAKVQASLRICAVSPEPPLLAHTSSESRGIFKHKARSLAPLNGWACAVKICHDGMFEDTNSLDRALICCHVTCVHYFCFIFCVVLLLFLLLPRGISWIGLLSGLKLYVLKHTLGYWFYCFLPLTGKWIFFVTIFLQQYGQN